MKKIIVFVITLSLLLSLMLTAVEVKSTDEVESFGETVKGINFESRRIYDWHDLDAVRDDLDGDYVLMNDLDEDTEGYDELVDTEDGWEPIGDYAYYRDVEFVGTFDGNEHIIRDLYIDRSDEGHVGLFGRIDDEGEITNIGVIDADVTGDRNVGALVGSNHATVENSYATGDVTGNRYVGGLVGYNSDGTIFDSYATGDVSGEEYVGGISGINRHGTVSDSYATGDVNGNKNVGGLVGYNSDGTIFGSYATGDVSGEEYVGGISGMNRRGMVSDSYAAADVNGEKNVGGLLGRTTGSVENSYYNIEDVLINGGNHITIGGLFDAQYQDWIEDKNLDIGDYSERLVPSGDYYEISCVEGFKDFLGFAMYEDYNLRLTEDIDLSEESGLYVPYLLGEFDGRGHTISNLSINKSFVSHAGMFSKVRGGRVVNTGLVDAYVSGDDMVGGLVGLNDFGIVENSYATGEVRGEKDVGALIGRNSGGIIYNSYATSDVRGDSNVGGLVATNSWRGTLNNSYAIGHVSGESRIGGLVGNNYGTVTDSFWDIESSGMDESDGGTGKTTAEMKDVATYTDTDMEGLEKPWDFLGDPNDDEGDEDIWDIDEDINDGYPFFVWDHYHTLNVTIEGEGAVEIDPDEDDYRTGAEVELIANPDEGWEFVEWTGDESGTASTITVTMNEDKEITAVFKEEEIDPEPEPEEEVPGFTSTLLLLAVVIAVAVYWKKR